MLKFNQPYGIKSSVLFSVTFILCHTVSLFDLTALTYKRYENIKIAPSIFSFIVAGKYNLLPNDVYYLSIRQSRINIALSLSPFIEIQSDIRNDITERDLYFMKMALHYATKGLGNTYPNPEVGCVLVSSTIKKKYEVNNQVIGSGFHAKAGFPHAEVIALLEACDYMESGDDSARSILHHTSSPHHFFGTYSILKENNALEKIQALLSLYLSSNGRSILFSRAFEGEKYKYNQFNNDVNDNYVTAYVTLEPCCHYGQTPPCVLSLIFSGVRRVVVGCLDPNPHVDGGGITLLRKNGVRVDLIQGHIRRNSQTKKSVAMQCVEIINGFVKCVISSKKNTNILFSSIT